MLLFTVFIMSTMLINTHTLFSWTMFLTVCITKSVRYSLKICFCSYLTFKNHSLGVFYRCLLKTKNLELLLCFEYSIKKIFRCKFFHSHQNKFVYMLILFFVVIFFCVLYIMTKLTNAYFLQISVQIFPNYLRKY